MRLEPQKVEKYFKALEKSLCRQLAVLTWIIQELFRLEEKMIIDYACKEDIEKVKAKIELIRQGLEKLRTAGLVANHAMEKFSKSCKIYFNTCEEDLKMPEEIIKSKKNKKPFYKKLDRLKKWERINAKTKRLRKDLDKEE